MLYVKTENVHKFNIIAKYSLNQGYFPCMDIFAPSGMILKSLINKTSNIRIPNVSISFFSKVVQWYIEHYSTEATTLLPESNTQKEVAPFRHD